MGDNHKLTMSENEVLRKRSSKRRMGKLHNEKSFKIYFHLVLVRRLHHEEGDIYKNDWENEKYCL